MLDRSSMDRGTASAATRAARTLMIAGRRRDMKAVCSIRQQWPMCLPLLPISSTGRVRLLPCGRPFGRLAHTKKVIHVVDLTCLVRAEEQLSQSVGDETEAVISI